MNTPTRSSLVIAALISGMPLAAQAQGTARPAPEFF